MRLIDYEQLSVRDIHFFMNAPTPPARTQVKRVKIKTCDWDRLFINLDAVVKQTYDGKSITLYDGDVVLIPKHVVYIDDIIKEGYSLILFLELSVDIPEGIYRWSFANNPEIKQKFLNLQNFWNEKKTGYYIRCMNEIYSILSMLIRQEKQNYTSSSQFSVVEPAIVYMKTHFSDPNLTIPHLADQCKLSYSHFRKIFFDVHGVSATAFLKKLRLDYACQLLSLGDCTISQIAQMSGFSDIYYFSSFFKRHIGMSPTEYQNMKIKKQQNT